MSRHRNVRGLNYDQEYDDVYNSAYSQSVEDDYCVSPGTEAQFTFNRGTNQDGSKISAYFQEWKARNDIMEEDSEDELEEKGQILDSCPGIDKLNETEKGQLISCVEELQNVVGETVPESLLTEKAMKHKFDVEKALDEVLNPQKWDEKKTELKQLSKNVKITQELKPQSDIYLNSLVNQLTMDSDHIKEARPLVSTCKNQIEHTRPSSSKTLSVMSPSSSQLSIDDDDFEFTFLKDIPSSLPINIHQSSSFLPSIMLQSDIQATNHDTSRNLFTPQAADDGNFLLSITESTQLLFLENAENIYSYQISSQKRSNFERVITAKYRPNSRKSNYDELGLRKKLIEYRTHKDVKDFDFIAPFSKLDCLKLGIRRAEPSILKENPLGAKSKTTLPEPPTPQKIDIRSTLSPHRDKRDCSVEKGRDRKKSPAPADRASGPQVIGSAKQVITVSRDAMQEDFNKTRFQGKPLINLVVVGHVDAGKSTLMGHLLYLLGCVSKKNMHRYETDSKKIGKQSFLYAWVLDETDEERNRGITMDIAQSRFETSSKIVNLLDAPGHRDFIPNMITGASHADAAILVVDATVGEFEAGFDSGGQTREHALLVRSLGVSQLAVVINKLDNVEWSKTRYQEVVSKLSLFLKQAGYKENEITYVPCSGLSGENLISPSKIPAITSWYSGPCLLEVIDLFKEPERPVMKPFRLSIADVFKGMVSGVYVSGRIESGAIQIGQKLVAMPSGEQSVVKALLVSETNISQAFAGDQVAITLTGCDSANISTGNILCDISDPSPVCSKFEAKILLFNDCLIPLTKGSQLVLHCKNLQEQAVIKKILSQLNKSTGKVIKNRPRCLTSNTSGLVEIETSRPISIELFQDFKDLGRIMLRSCGTTIAAGLVTKIL